MRVIEAWRHRPSAALGWTSVLATVALFIAGNALRGATPDRLIAHDILTQADGWWIRLSPIYALTFAIVGALIVARRPGNLIGWVCCSIGVLTELYQFGLGYSIFGMSMNPGLPGVSIVKTYENWGWIPPVVLMLFFLPLLFPDGRPISPRWWWLTPLVLLGFALGSFSIHPGQLLGVAGILLANASLVIRFRRAGPDVRQQIRWFAIAGLVLAGVALSGVVVGFVVYHNNTVVFNPGFDILTPLAFAGLALSIGIAVLRYHLYDIDLFIRQALVYGTLVVLISVLWFFGVVTLGSRIGPLPKNDQGAAVAVGAIIALLFQPVRRQLQRFANRLVYGKRATPYEVLSRFSEQMSEMYSTAELPSRMAEVLGTGVAADRATVWLRVGKELREAASWPEETSPHRPIPLSDGQLPTIADASETVPVRYQGEMLGALAVAKREPLTATERRLLGDLSQQSGPVLKSARLTAELIQRLDELQASRQRIITAQDTARRQLERNLHDGAQQNLVALKLKIALAKRLAISDPQKAQAALDELTGETDDAIETLRDLARGLYPPILAQEGLAAAIEAHARRLPLPVKVTAGNLHRYSQQTEASVYFCVLEALQNVVKHSGAHEASVTLDESNGRLVFAVVDDGHGFDPATAESGSGMQNMRDRIEVLGGTLEIESSAGSGSRIVGSVPISRAS